MTHEMRSITRLVPLWIVLVAALALTFYSVQQLAVSIAKTTTPEISQTAKTDMYAGGMGMGYAGGYGSYCLIPPMYPILSSSSGVPGAPMTADDKAAIEKYNQETEKYNAEYMAACKADLEKQEMLKGKGLNSTWFSSIAVYSILSLFGIFASALTLLVIKRAEQED